MINEFLADLYADIFDKINDDDAGGLRRSAFAEVLLARLEEANMIPPARVAYAEVAPNATLKGEIDGYAFDAESSALMLFYCIEGNALDPIGSDMQVRTIFKDEIDKGFRRLEGFVKAVGANQTRHIDISDPAFEVVQLIREYQDKDFVIYLYVLCSGTASDRALGADRKGVFHKEVWDLPQFLRYCAGSGEDRIRIDFERDFGGSLPCLTAPGDEEELKVLLTSIPGEVLADIYSQYRSRLLERNVRAFLQVSGSVNKGMKMTVKESPSRFLSFNNGLTATASSVDLEDLGNGLARIKAVDDFQIVNGGQTTATLSWCKTHEKYDVDKISVAMKLTVVSPGQVDELVPLISKYANTQNKILASDLSANDPWHTEFERLSRSYYTPPTGEFPRGTRWYYERARGQYKNDLVANKTSAGQKKFKLENPANQKLQKTDLAKHIMSWEQRPEIVNRGGQASFVELSSLIKKEARPSPDQALFTQYIALSILFKTAEKLYDGLGLKGQKAPFVAYAVALLSYDYDKRLPFQEIFRQQSLTESLRDELELRIQRVQEYLFPRQTAVTRFSTYLKGVDCWSTLVSNIGKKERVPQEYEAYTTAVSSETLKQREGVLLEGVATIPQAVWFRLSGVVFAFDYLESTEKAAIYAVSQRLSKGELPTRSEALEAKEGLRKAVELGYTDKDLTLEMIRRISALQ